MDSETNNEDENTTDFEVREAKKKETLTVLVNLLPFVKNNRASLPTDKPLVLCIHGMRDKECALCFRCSVHSLEANKERADHDSRILSIQNEQRVADWRNQAAYL